jgi:MFS transporter, ACS family, D-galactonate transporter
MTTPVHPSAAPSSRQSMSPELSRLAVLLALSIFINYVDRGNLAIAAPLIQDELHLSPYQLGLLFSSFFWTYAIFQIVSGWLVDQFSVNWLLAAGVLLWSAATFGTGLVHSFTMILFMRLVLGAGESVAYPSYSKIIACYFPESQRGRANALICAGQASGPALGTLLGGLLMAQIGWRLFFVALGVASALWLIPWARFKPSETRAVETRTASAATLLQLLGQRSVWGTFAGLFCYNYLSYFLITWLPSYLVRERHFSLERMSVTSAGAFLAIAVSAMISGWLSDRWIAAGATVTRVRKTFTGVGPILASSIIFVSVVTDHLAAIGLLVLVSLGMGMCTSNLWAVTQTLAGPPTAGKWTGLQNFVGNLAGWIAPALTGFILGRTGRFFWAFAITSVVTLLGSVAWFLVVGPLQPIDWQAQRRSVSVSLPNSVGP